MFKNKWTGKVKKSQLITFLYKQWTCRCDPL